MIFLVIPALWLALIVVLVALCAAARRGDKVAADLLAAVETQPAEPERPAVAA
jgi:hypothetical protein